MKKVVVNKCFGGFGLTDMAMERYKELGGTHECYYDIPRDDKILVQVVAELGPKADNSFSKLEVVEIPDDVNFVITEYDGFEKVEEEHRSW